MKKLRIVLLISLMCSFDLKANSLIIYQLSQLLPCSPERQELPTNNSDGSDSLSLNGYLLASSKDMTHSKIDASSEPAVALSVKLPFVSSEGQAENLISGSYPNPFNSSTVISYKLKEEIHVLLKIYNSDGEEVKTLADEVEKPGLRAVSWDGRDDEGNELTSGTYYYHLKAGDYSESGKMMLRR